MVTITVRPEVGIGKDLKRDSDPYANTSFKGMAGFNVTIRCSAVVPQGQDNSPDLPENQNKDCNCQLDGIEATANFEISYNPGKLNRSYFDWETKEGYPGPRRGTDPELDEENARVHEMTHVRDATKALEDKIKDIIDHMDPSSKTCTQPCKLRERCRDTIKRLIETRLRAVAAKEWSDLANSSVSHSSTLEQNARQAQCNDFRDNPRTDGRRSVPRPRRRLRNMVIIGGGIIFFILFLMVIFQSMSSG